MWEQIRSNRIRSALLISCMAVILIVLGYFIGQAAFYPEGGPWGVLVALTLWTILWVMAAAGGRQILLSSIHAREIAKDDAPQLFNIVEEMTIASGLARMPKIYLIDNDAPNAFAAGKPENSAVAVTTGLMMRLNRDELQGVIAHEIGHIKNHDTRFMTIAGVMVAVIVLMADAYLRTFFYTGAMQRRSTRSRSGKGGGGGGHLIIIVIALVMAVLAPLLAQLLYFASSRKREYLADASAARFTRYPEGLASALEKISLSAGTMSNVNRAHAPMFIINPLRAQGGSSIFSTHPPTSQRIKVLREMGGAGFAEYEKAFSRITRGHAIGRQTIQSDIPIDKRAPSPDMEKDGLAKARETVDILHRMAGMLFLHCVCGLNIKVPESYNQSSIFCPKCRRSLLIPAVATAVAPSAMASAKEKEPETPMTYRFKPGGWQSFRCSCGHTLHLSPAFSGTHIMCSRCNRRTDVIRS